MLGADSLKLTLEGARELALKGHPAIAAQEFQAQASRESGRQLRAGLGPQFTAGVTGSVADEFSRFVFAGVSSPALFSRFGGGVQMTQMIHDFGRAKEGIQAAKLRADGQREGVKASRLQVILALDRAYYGVLSAKAREELAARNLQLLRNLPERAEDSNAASLRVMEAEFQLVKAANDRKGVEAELVEAIGLKGESELDLADGSAAGQLPETLELVIQQAMQERPELRQLSLELEASAHQMEAERKASRPTISAMAVGGLIPATTFPTFNHYGSASVSISIPIWNGRLFESRQNEAALRMRAVEKVKADQENQISRQLRLSYLSAKTAFERMKFTRAVVQEARTRTEHASAGAEALEARLNESAAGIEHLIAGYEYLLSISALRWQSGEVPH